MSIYIGNVDYSATEEELRNAFIGCGDIVRVTIIKNMRTGHPKGAAFIEFTDKDGVHAAMTLNGKQVKGKHQMSLNEMGLLNDWPIITILSFFYELM